MTEAQSEFRIHAAKFVTISLAATMTGLTEKAIRRKIEEGKWLVGREVFKSPDGGVFVSLQGFEDWIGRGQRG
jgi:hypothetical protein